MDQLVYKQREKAIFKTSLLGIIANLLLVAGKATIGFIAGSSSIVLDAVNNLTDATSSAVTMIGTKISAKKPDKKHPYGHGRTEYLASLTVGVIVLLAGSIALFESVKGIIDDPTGSEKPSYSIAMLILIGAGVLVKIFLGIYFRKVGKKHKSDALTGAGTDALFDAVLSFSTLVSAFISYLGFISLENYLAAIIGLFIIRAGILMLRQAYSLLIGERASKEQTQNLRKKIGSYPEVKGVYDLTFHNYGPSKSIASAHIEVDDEMTAKQIHDLTRRITTDIYLDSGTIITIGIYSSNSSNPLAGKMKEDIIRIIKDFPTILQLHGFYMREEDKVVSVDLIISFDDREPEKTMEDIKNRFSSIHPDYKFFIVRDFDLAD